jgi:RimJ/RimL family protein N-acetyltransferase
MNTWEPEPMTEEIKRDQDRRFPSDGIRRRMIGEVDGVAVGFSVASRVPFEKPGQWWISVTVDPGSQGNGFGRALFEDALAFAKANGATKVCDYLFERQPRALRFAENLGASRSEHLFESTVDPRTFDFGRYETLIDKLKGEGIEFITFTDTAQDEAAKRKFYDLHVATDRDMPHATPDHMYTYEQLMRWLMDAYWWNPKGFFIAVDGDQWVGMVGIAMFKPEKAYNDYAGVVRSHRGRGICTALKVFGMRFALEQGACQVRTNNHLGNEPMLAINDKLGYVAEPGWYRYDLYLEGKE